MGTPVLLAQEALEHVPDALGLCERLTFGTHEGISLHPPLGAAHGLVLLFRLSPDPLPATSDGAYHQRQWWPDAIPNLRSPASASDGASTGATHRG